MIVLNQSIPLEIAGWISIWKKEAKISNGSQRLHLEIDGVGYFRMPRRKEAKDAGVEVLSLKCHVGMDRLEII